MGVKRIKMGMRKGLGVKRVKENEMGINVGVKLSSQKTKDKRVKVGVKVGVKKPLFSSDILGVSAVVKVLAPKLPKPFARCVMHQVPVRPHVY